jgi:beta-glucosidase
MFACAALSLWAGPAGADASPPPRSDAEIAGRVDALLSRMSPEEKAGQLSQYFYLAQYPKLNQGVDEALARGEVGAMLFVSDPAQINRLQKIAVENTRLGIPLLFGFDVIHGLRTIFPTPLGMAASWDPSLVEQTQAAAAAEARAVGIGLTFAPMVDVTHDIRWGRSVEGAGEDPYLASAMAAAQVRGFQGASVGTAGRVIATPKHLAGYGASVGGRDYDEVELSDNELWNTYLPPFKAAIDAGAGGMMSAYMPLNGVPATANRWLLTTVLRDTWGFDGLVVSDSGAVASLKTHGVAADDTAAAALALGAGVDLAMIPPRSASPMRLLPAAVSAGLTSQGQVDAAVRRVLRAKFKLGLFDHPYVDETKVESVLNDPQHSRLARLAAERSAVLLRNQGGLLPLDRKAIKSIAVLGPLADSSRDVLGPWTFPQNKPPSISILAGLRLKAGSAVRIDYVEGARMPKRLHPSPFAMMEGPSPPKPTLDERAEIARSVDLANKSDVTVLVLGEAQDMIGEAASRSTLDLPGRQQELLDAVVATGKPVIVLLMSARPLDLKDSKAAAILDIGYPGSQAGPAVADLLFGDATPGGKLPFSWIRSAAHAPYTYAHATSHDPKGADQRYWNESSAPRYPFGYGLSYTTFAYSNLRIEGADFAVGQSIPISVDLTNSGKKTGDEVAQLYIHQRLGASSRPVRQLKGFQRVTLKPGETRTVRFVLKPDDLRYWSTIAGAWVQDQSDFDIWVGGDSTADLAGKFTVHK